MSAIPTVKIQSKEHGFMWINECDLTPEMEIYLESGDGETEDKPVVAAPTKKRTAAKG